MIENKTVLLTGASSGIGEKIALMLCQEGYTVYGIGRDFEKTDKELLDNPLFKKIICDITDTQALTREVKTIRKETPINVLINNAACAWYGLHEEISPDKISKMVRTNLEAPMIITQLLLRDFKKSGGTIINISSVTAISSSNPHGAAYGAIKAGLLSFGNSIFEEARKYGVKVTTIMPDMTRTNLYRNADFEADDTTEAGLDPTEVAESVKYILDRPDGVTIPQLVIRPQLHRIKKK
ncbi:Short-chain dehydrogenase [Butyrivibrio fibrisolvens DSM 3071]|uniref:Short-chain dehydrogenase n=1 Tax=Butyrivibrio fibrisolvens DSM 3071 TaxID=1121131 RepID=A0A1M5X2C4_BUTFI|nr:SDR family oxidoreductase [Butyrivibrio fibrisolvens]SHH93959.1 Short-chain dehydrogenase [Butyrivibrio fibrisolvens DSM 3071]